MSGNTERLNTALAGRYKIAKQLGQGGMATVYLAHDEKHDRKVAVKVLKPELAAVLGAERFVVEIKTTAALQHPHILPVFDSGTADGFLYYVMPYIEGETLRGKLNRETQLGIDEAVRITTQVADALDYAHRHGVIHRDIKPENILLHDGRPMVADFGIALAVSAAAGGRMTETGLSLGTPHYMSPEQATAEKEITGRSDIYSLASVLYEMLAGEPPHGGGSAQQIIMKIITETAQPVTARRRSVPPNVAAAIAKALEKLPADRFESAKAFLDALANPTFATVGVARGPRRLAAVGFGIPAMVVTGLLIAILAAAAGWLSARRGVAAAMPPSRLAIDEPVSGVAFSGIARTVDISRDGEKVLWLATHPLGARVLVRRLDAPTAQPVANSASMLHLKFGPDGRSLYAASGASMQRISLEGGTWTPITGMERTSFYSFSKDGELWWSSAVGYGTYRRGADGRDSLVFPRSTINQVLPDGRHAIAVAVTPAANTGSVQYLDLRTGEIKGVFDSPIVEVRYTMGYLLYVTSDGRLMAAQFDSEAGVITGPHMEIATGVSVGGGGIAQFAVSDNGTVVYIPGASSDLVRVSLSGNLRVIGDMPRRFHSPRISPDGQRIAFDDVSPVEGRDVWVYTQGVTSPTRATFQRDGHDVSWMLDGRGLYYASGNVGRIDLFSMRFNSTAAARAESVGVEVAYTGTPLPAGGFLATVPGATGHGLDIAILRPRAGKADTVLASPADESFAVPSPNGKWFAYISDHSGQPEAYIRALGGGTTQLQVSLDGASEPMWSRDGRQLFYRRDTPSGAELVAASLEFGAEPRVVKRTSLFDVSNFDTASPHANYDVSPDGTWFVFARRSGSDHVVVLQNVPELARRLARGAAAR